MMKMRGHWTAAKVVAAASVAVFLGLHNMSVISMEPVLRALWRSSRQEQEERCNATLDFDELWQRRLQEQELKRQEDIRLALQKRQRERARQCVAPINFEEIWEGKKRQEECLEPEAPEVMLSAQPTPLVRFDPLHRADADLKNQYAFTAAMMIFVWFSICFGQLQQTSSVRKPKPGWKEEEPLLVFEDAHEPVEVSLSEADDGDDDLMRRIERRIRKEQQKKTLFRKKHLLQRLHVQPRTKDSATHQQMSGSLLEAAVKDEVLVEERDAQSRREKDSCKRIRPAFADIFMICPACSTKSSPNWRFCSSCGSPLSSGIESVDLDVAPNVQDPSQATRPKGRTIKVSQQARTLVARRQDLARHLRTLRTARSKSAERMRTPPVVERKLSRSNSTGSILSFKTAEEPENEDEREAPPMSITTASPQCNLLSKTNGAPLHPRPAISAEFHKENSGVGQTKTAKSTGSKAGTYSAIVSKPTPIVNDARQERQTTPAIGTSEVLSIKFRKTDSVCVGSRLWPLSHLRSRYPPQWGHPNKQLIADIASNPDHDGWVRASRWSRPSALPNRIKRAKVYVESGHFSYDTSASKRDHKTAHWHLNFAGDRLFSSGGGIQVTRDDVQAMEHPCLPSLALAIADTKTHGVEGLSTQTYEPQAGPTPILIKGAQRTCTIDSTILRYQTFSEARADVIQVMTTRLQIPSTTNIVALPAVTPGKGKYTVAQIRRLFIYAYTGFRAVVLESGGQNAILHTGFWGCGSGLNGNKGLTAAIQILAAGTAGIKYIHFKPGNHSAFDRSAMWHGINVANELHSKSFDVAINILASAGYVWGDQGPAHLPYQPPPDSIWTN